MSDIKKGDLVRVTIEGVIHDSEGLGIFLHDGCTYINTKKPGVSVERIEPPVVQFKPGDRLRRRNGMAYEVTLGVDGYLHHSTDHFFRFSDPLPRGFFNSERFEKINLS